MQDNETLVVISNVSTFMRCISDLERHPLSIYNTAFSV